MSNILVPIDFSKASNTAVGLAVDWSGILNSHIMLLHTYRLIRNTSSRTQETPRSIRESLISNKNKEFNKLESSIDLSKAHSYKFHLELGFLPSCIERLSNESKVDLIVYGVKNEDEHAYVDLIRILESENSPVLLVSENYDLGTSVSTSIHQPITLLIRKISLGI